MVAQPEAEEQGEGGAEAQRELERLGQAEQQLLELGQGEAVEDGEEQEVNRSRHLKNCTSG